VGPCVAHAGSGGRSGTALAVAWMPASRLMPDGERCRRFWDDALFWRSVTQLGDRRLPPIRHSLLVTAIVDGGRSLLIRKRIRFAALIGLELRLADGFRDVGRDHGDAGAVDRPADRISLRQGDDTRLLADIRRELKCARR
jgi:hypothetical protein